MPAKKKTAAKKTSAAKKPAAKKTAAKKAASKPKKTAAKKPTRPRKKSVAATATRGVPDSIRRLAEREAAKDRREKAEAHARAVEEAAVLRDGDDDTPTPFEPESPVSFRDLSEASEPGVVLRQRARQLGDAPAGDALLGDLVDGRGPEPRSSNGDHRPSIGDVVIDVEDLHVFYGSVEALKGISFKVREGETVAIIGSNGAGKTTTLKTVSGVSELLKTVRGKITILGTRVESASAHKIARLGVAHSPEGRKIFPNQTVRDNLMLGAFGRKDSEIDRDIARMEERFPILGQRRNQPAGLMSGGEQQMLAMARALMARPKVLLFDEPSMGLAPLIVKQIFDIIEELKREGKTILLVEQMAFQALGIADRAYVLETGEITMEGSGRDLLEDPRVKEAYLGA